MGNLEYAYRMCAEFRFAVGKEGGLRSTAWKFWTQGDEAYLIGRGQGVHKFSFHKSGINRFAKVDSQLSSAERLLSEWKRPALVDIHEGCSHILLSLIVPYNHLSSW